MALSPYRPLDGWLVRRLFFVLTVAFGGFSAFRIYIWSKAWTHWLPIVSGHVLNWGEVTGTVVMAAFFLFAYYLMFLNHRSSDFLVEIEGELRKVSWPEFKPIGSPKAELWGSTYVVIGVVIVMAIFIGLVDLTFNFFATRLFFR